MKKFAGPLVSVIVLSIGVVAAEISLRRFAPLPDPYRIFKLIHPYQYIRAQFPPYVRVRTQAEPGLPGVSPHNTFSTNNIGFRGDDLVMPKPASEYRIVLIGGSTMECFYLDDSQAVNAVLERELNQGAGRGVRVKVYNAGRSGDKSDDHVSMLVHRVVHLDPDMVVISSGVNDLSASIFKFDYRHIRLPEEPRVLPFSELLKMAATEFQLPRRIYYALRRASPKSERDLLEEIPERSDYRDKVSLCARTPVSEARPQPATGAYEKNLRTLAGVARAHGIRLVWMTQQATWNSAVDPRTKDWQWMLLRFGVRYRAESMDAALVSLNEVMRRLAREDSTPLYDAGGTLPKSQQYFYDDVHWTVAGANRAGSELAAVIRQAEPVLREGRFSGGPHAFAAMAAGPFAGEGAHAR